MKLWPHQLRGLKELWRLYEAGAKRICLTSPTGGGKSRMMTELIQHAQFTGKRVCLYTNRILLTSQNSRALDGQGVEHGIRAAGFDPALLRDVQICSIATEYARCIRRQQWQLHEADIVVVDEIHGQKAGMSMAVFGKHLEQGATLMGFTATPLGIGHMFDQLVVAGTNSELRKCGALLPCTTFAPDEPDVSQIRRNKVGEYNYGDVVKVIHKQVLFGRVVEWYKKVNPFQRPAILFAPGVSESKWFADMFTRCGIRSAHIDGKHIFIDDQEHQSTPELRQMVLDESRTGAVKVLCNRFVLREGIDCLDDQTEILTTSGWRGIGEVSDGDCVYTMNRQTERMEHDVVQRYVERPAEAGERMFSISSQHVNIRTSERHEFYIKYTDPHGAPPHRRSVSWLKRTGCQLAARRSDYALPISAEMEDGALPGIPLTDDEIRFVAWFMTDGGFSQEYVAISQSKHYHNDIRELLRRIGVDYRERVRFSKTGYSPSRPLHEFLVPKGTHHGKHARAGWFKYAHYLDKTGPALLRDMTRNQFLVFWSELLKGDGGNFQGNRSGVLWCCLKSQADLYMELAVTRGLAASVYTSTTPNGVTMYAVRVRDSQWIASRPSDHRAARIELSSARPGERLWCVTTRNGTIVTRRKGRVAIIGNCPWLYHCIMATPFGSTTSYLQAGGRLLRNHPSLDHVILQDHGGSCFRHGSLNEDRTWDLKDDEFTYNPKRMASRKAEKIREPICCPNCGGLRMTGVKCPYCGHHCGFRFKSVIQIDGTLKRVSAEQERTRKKRRTVEEGQRKWNNCFWALYRRNPDATMRTVAGFHHRKHGCYPAKSLKGVPQTARQWSMSLGEFRQHM